MKILLKIMQTIGWDKTVFVPLFWRKRLRFISQTVKIESLYKNTIFVPKVIKITIRDVTLHIMKSDVLVSVPIKFLFSDFEQNSFVRQRIHI